MTKTTFVQQAEGSFTSLLMPGTPHCGPTSSDKPIPATFGYKVTLHYDADALDEHGFLLDNTDFSSYFNAMDRIEISCEELCEQAESVFCNMLETRRGHCHGITVEISPMPGVWVEYSDDPSSRNHKFSMGTILLLAAGALVLLTVVWDLVTR